MGLEPVIPTSLTSIVNLSLLDLSYTGIQVRPFVHHYPLIHSVACLVLHLFAHHVHMPRRYIQDQLDHIIR